VNLDKVFDALNPSEQKLLREILLDDELPVSLDSAAEAETLLDNLRIWKLERELRDVQTCIAIPEFAAKRRSLVAYQRALRRVLDPPAREMRKIFCRQLAEKEAQWRLPK
jgi:hypothetical protein